MRRPRCIGGPCNMRTSALTTAWPSPTMPRYCRRRAPAIRRCCACQWPRIIAIRALSRARARQSGAARASECNTRVRRPLERVLRAERSTDRVLTLSTGRSSLQPGQKGGLARLPKAGREASKSNAPQRPSSARHNPEHRGRGRRKDASPPAMSRKQSQSDELRLYSSCVC